MNAGIVLLPSLIQCSFLRHLDELSGWPLASHKAMLGIINKRFLSKMLYNIMVSHNFLNNYVWNETLGYKPIVIDF